MRTKIVTSTVLRSILDDLRSRGKKIVFTNGCFDILHIGHLRYLEEARGLGDGLVVGLNSDTSVRQIKGPERPFVPELERAEMLAGFQCVDYVVIFEETTPNTLISELRPEIHVKGGDYTIDTIPEAGLVRSLGGEVVVLPHVEGRSTTNLVSKVRSGEHGTVQNAERGRVVGMIPARLAATRLPNKPLLDICGKPMIQWVFGRACESLLLDEVFVVTPDAEIKQAVESFGGKAIMTSAEHRSGTDRLAEAMHSVDADLVINIQGDEPLLDSQAIDLLAQAMLDSPEVPMGSLMCPISDEEEKKDPAVVKVVTDRNGLALYFSRSPIPYPRHPEAARVCKHIGIYAYRKDFLIEYASMKPTPLEMAESLEQLRALENGHRIRMVETCFSPTSVDTPEDLERVRTILSSSAR